MEKKDLESLKRIGDVLKKSKSVILIPHVNIDGDDLGSMTALSLGLNSLGIKTVCMSHDLIPDNLKFLRNVDKFVFSQVRFVCFFVPYILCTSHTSILLVYGTFCKKKMCRRNAFNVLPAFNFSYFPRADFISSFISMTACLEASAKFFSPYPG